MIQLLWFTNWGSEIRKERETWELALAAYQRARKNCGANFGRWSSDGGMTWEYF